MKKNSFGLIIMFLAVFVYFPAFATEDYDYTLDRKESDCRFAATHLLEVYAAAKNNINVHSTSDKFLEVAKKQKIQNLNIDKFVQGYVFEVYELYLEYSNLEKRYSKTRLEEIYFKSCMNKVYISDFFYQIEEPQPWKNDIWR